ncbi:MAG: hypothetical protein AAF985_15315, partial [Bacteroidota bacterium]
MIFPYSTFSKSLTKPWLRLSSILLACFFLSVAFTAPPSSSLPELKEDPEITLLSSQKTVDFILTKNNKINIKLTVVEEVSAKRKSATYAKFIFFDGNSEIKKIRVKRKRVTPAVSDYELDGIFHNDLKIAFFDYTFQKSLDPIKVSYEKVYYDYKFMDLL